ncbi:aldo/keto reductase [Tardiphaga sp.]|uniref:aldo/keto reductase n=1 Tax=Tardiphaga sp. TaxID=1926292 RepID=UPI0025D81E49|nr:aldo/keto reductase [Tardiphaga sp.]
MTTSIDRLALGTVQFGVDYGITNVGGRVAEDEVAAILALAAGAGIDLLDTAHLYGASEAVLGAIPMGARFTIVTKTPKFGACGSAAEAVALLHSGFEQSLAQLARDRVGALLFHDADDLLGPWGYSLWQAMGALKAAGRTDKIGCSVYEGAQIDAALDRYPLDLVQLPYNVLDRRLDEGGQLTRLSAARIEVHARSIFLQGLLLQDPAAIPPSFGPLADAVRAIHVWGAQAGLTPLEAVLAATLREQRIDRLVLGVTRVSELRAILVALACGAGGGIDAPPPPPAPPINARYLNPAHWNYLQ